MKSQEAGWTVYYLGDDGDVRRGKFVKKSLLSNVIDRNGDFLIWNIEPVKRSDFIVTGILTFSFEDFILLPGAAFESVEAHLQAASTLTSNNHQPYVNESLRGYDFRLSATLYLGLCLPISAAAVLRFQG